MTQAARCALIVEPSRARRSVLAALLREAGAEFAEAASMVEALQQVGRRRFDLVCIADQLPDGTGAKFCTAVRDAPDTAPMPILVLSPEPEAETVKTLREAGASDIMDRHDVERVRQFLAMVLTPLPVLNGRVVVVDDDAEEAGWSSRPCATSASRSITWPSRRRR